MAANRIVESLRDLPDRLSAAQLPDAGVSADALQGRPLIAPSPADGQALVWDAAAAAWVAAPALTATGPLLYTPATRALAFDLTGVLTPAGNLAGVRDAAAARANLGLGSSATRPESAFVAAGGDASATLVTPAGTNTARSLAARFGAVFSPGDFGAKADAAILAGVSATAGSPSVTAPGSAFTAADVGKAFSLPGAGAGGATLSGTIASVPLVAPATTSAIAILSVAPSTAVTGGTLTYGTDDRAALQSCLNAAFATGADCTVDLGRGSYLLNGYHPSSPLTGQIYMLKWGNFTASPARPASVQFVGQGAKLVSPLCGSDSSKSSLMLYLVGYCQPKFRGLTFENTHGVTPGGSLAVRLSGGSSNLVKNALFHDCTFRNFQNALYLDGCVSPQVVHCSFLYDKGRDSGSTTYASPNVGIASYVGASGATSDLTVHGCTFDGCVSGDVSGNSGVWAGMSGGGKVALDGLVFGCSRGWTVTNNRIRNHGFEAIYLCLRQGETTVFPTVVSGNAIASALVSGTTPYTLNYSIRCDEPGALINGNMVTGATHGIYSNAADTNYDTPGRISDMHLVGNRVMMSGTEAATAPASQYGFRLTAIDRLHATGNSVVWPGGYRAPTSGGIGGWYLTSCTSVDIHSDKVFASVRSATTPALSGYNVLKSANVVIHSTALTNLDYGLTLQSGAPAVGDGTTSTVLLKEYTSAGLLGLLSSASNTDTLTVRKHSVTFTPAAGATGWYRVASNGTWVSGKITIAANYDGFVTDTEFHVLAPAFTAGTASGYFLQTRHSTIGGGNGGVFSLARTYTDDAASGVANLDLFLSRATAPGPITITFEPGDKPYQFLQDPPTFLGSAVPVNAVTSFAFAAGTRSSNANGMALLNASNFNAGTVPNAQMPFYYPDLQTNGTRTYISHTFDPASANSAAPLAAGTVYLARVVGPKAFAALGARLCLASNAGSLANVFVGLYDTGGNRVAVSANLAAAWGSTAGMTDAPFISAFTLATGAVYYLAVLVGAGAVSLQTSGAPAAIFDDLSSAPNARFSTHPVTGVSTLPATFTTTNLVTTAPVTFWAGLYR